MGRNWQGLIQLKTVLVCLGLMIISTHVQAQIQGNAGVYDEGFRPQFNEKVNAEDQARENTLRMKRELKLNPDQLKQVGRINLQYEKEFQDQLANSPNMTDYDKAMLYKIRKQQMDALKEVLTGEQWQMFIHKRLNFPAPQALPTGQ